MRSRNLLDCLWSSVLLFQQISGWLKSQLSEKGLFFFQIEQSVADTHCNIIHTGLPVIMTHKISAGSSPVSRQSSMHFHCYPMRSAITLLGFSDYFHPSQYCSHVSYSTTSLWSQWGYMPANAHKHLWFPLCISHGVCISTWSFTKAPSHADFPVKGVRNFPKMFYRHFLICVHWGGPPSAQFFLFSGALSFLQLAPSTF